MQCTKVIFEQSISGNCQKQLLSTIQKDKFKAIKILYIFFLNSLN